MMDMSYAFDESTVYWPNAAGFKWEKESWGKSPAGYWYAAARYAASEHGGTHLDSPIHFGEGKLTIDAIPLEQLVGPAIVIDITKSCSTNPDYALTVADVKAWQSAHGDLPSGVILLVRTGWGQFWPDRKRYLGSDVPKDVANLHFPGISKEAAEYVSENYHVHGVGIDTASLDPGTSKDFIVHQILNSKDIYGLENIANLNKLPETGATLIALPMKIKGGSGGPVRIVAALP
jgi:kynurenine formamidase